jgi:tetratricopeptide (TPR) repeat protein
MRMLTPGEIAAEIERNLDFLSGKLRGAPERHHSLRAVFEHSWALLSAPEQRALSMLSVLRGPFGRQAAQAVIFGVDQPTGMNVLGLMTSLVDKSLLRRLTVSVAGGSFAIHELLKQYAAEKLAESPEALQEALDRHCAYFMDFLANIWQDLRGPPQLDALAQIDAQIDDIRLAWRTALTKGRLRALRGAMPALFQFYNVRNRFQDAEEDFRLGVAELERLRSQPGFWEASPELSDGVYALALAFFSSFLFNVGRFEPARAYHRDSFALVGGLSEGDRAAVLLLLSFGWNVLPQSEVVANYQTCQETFIRHQDRWSAARAQLNFGSFQQYGVVDMEKARRLYQAAYDELRQLGDRFGMVLALNSLADLAYAQGKYEQVTQIGLESRSITRQLGDSWQVVASIFYLGQAAVAQGEYEQAHEYYDEGIRVMKELGNRQLLSRLLACQGYVHYLQGRYLPAQAQFEQALELSRQLHDRRETAMQLMNLGNIARASGNLAGAQRSYQESIQLLEGSGANWELAISLKRLASLYFAQGEISQASEHYRRALRISIEIKRPAETLENLVGIAELLILEGSLETAAELLAMCLAQKETAQDVRAQAVRLLDGLAGELPAERYALAVKRGQAAVLNTAAEKMLAE